MRVVAALQIEQRGRLRGSTVFRHLHERRRDLARGEHDDPEAPRRRHVRRELRREGPAHHREGDFMSLRSAKNSTDLLSGDQKGCVAPSEPARRPHRSRPGCEPPGQFLIGRSRRRQSADHPATPPVRNSAQSGRKCPLKLSQRNGARRLKIPWQEPQSTDRDRSGAGCHRTMRAIAPASADVSADWLQRQVIQRQARSAAD